MLESFDDVCLGRDRADLASSISDVIRLETYVCCHGDYVQKRARGNVRERRVAMTACCQRKEPRARSGTRMLALCRSCRRSSRLANVIKRKKGTIEITTIQTCKKRANC